MASPPQAKDVDRRLPPPYLSPPEEAALSNFSKDAGLSPAQTPWRTTKLPPIHTPHSPPASPTTSTPVTLAPINSGLPQTAAAHDPPLFSHSQSDENAAPLFDDGRRDSDFTAPRNDSLSPEKTNAKPKKIFARLLHHFNGDQPALDYWRMGYEELSSIPGYGAKKHATLQPPVANTGRLDAYTASLKHSLDHPSEGRITKAKQSPPKPKAVKPAKVAVPPTPLPRKPRAPAVPRESKSQSVEPQARKRAPPSKHAPLKAEDKDWAKLPDYSPPTSTLDHGAKPLKVTWKGSPNDLRTDPEVQFMHPQEVEAAAELKLFGAQYLANKRRIFIAKVGCLREGKNFTKTAAQQACNIDVNKTSKLWEAYDKSGWFDREHFEKFL
ncbi:hypothetical protein WHR41_08495 [Cladosporium halotolerans]|uniref:SWIRM domain-containing protein n=1 Tax=Cladosporium halotolerans TaxID=1052096 RepID=A0AB34KEA3_9PEZI